MLDDIALFIHIVQQGGLSGASNHLSLPAATVTRRLQKLESTLGCQLLNRSARQCVLTQEGEVYYQTYAELIEQFEQAQQLLSRDRDELRGKLKVLAPTNISHGFLKPMWLGFMRNYPDIQLDLVLSNQVQDIAQNKADIAIRIGPQPDSLLYQLKVGQIDRIMVSSPQFIEHQGTPETPTDIKNFRVVGTSLFPNWKLKNMHSGQSQEIFPKFAAVFNDTSFVKYLVCDGQGISLLPITEINTELEAGALVRILPEWRAEDLRDIFLVWPSGRLLNAKAKCLRDYIQTYIAENIIHDQRRP
ncbi:MAG: LysR family transcriptional regulator [Pseudomonadales bacterium]|nr:LysR family transcriptional regulator [Pseudomonadales bacterium]